MPPRVLFISCNQEDYLADGLFHGLRTVLGDQVIDYPKLEFHYDDYPRESRRPLYGRGFTMYGLLPDLDLDRTRIFERAIAGEFDLIVFSNIWQTFGLFTQLAPQLPSTQSLAIVDGADRIEPYPYSGYWWRKPAWWFLPRAHTRGVYFKREITPWTGTFRAYLALPPRLASRLKSVREMREISFSIPEQLITDGEPSTKDQLLASHVVDPEMAELVGASTSYVFDDQDHYYADLRRSRFGITTKKAGWDCLRHYEQAANGCVPCFRDLDRKPARCAPHGLDRTNSITYSDPAHLLKRLEAVGEDEYESLRAGALAWARANTTRARAHRFLAESGFPIEPASRQAVGNVSAR